MLNGQRSMVSQRSIVCADEVLGQLLHLDLLEPALLALTGVGGEALGLEDDLGAQDVVCAELVRRDGALGPDVHLEGADVVELDAVAGLQVALDDVAQLGQHGDDVGALHGDVLLDLLAHLAGADDLHHLGVGVPLACFLLVLGLTLILAIIDCHNVFCFFLRVNKMGR